MSVPSSGSRRANVRWRSGIRFEVHQANLEAASSVFADMFELASNDSSGETPCLELKETAATLEVLLPYIYPRSVLDAYLSFLRDWTLVRACDKYSVWRAIEALRSSLTGAFFFQPNSQVLTMCGRSSTSAGRVLMVAYIFACHFGFDKLASQAVEQLAVQGSFSQTCASLSRNQPELLISAADATNLVRPFFVAPGGKSIDLVAAFSLRG